MEKDVMKYSKNGMVACCIIGIASIVIFIAIILLDKNISDIVLFGALLILLLVTCSFGFFKFYKQFKNPEKYISTMKDNNTINRQDLLLYNAEYSWDIAEGNYRMQYNKNNQELTDKDEKIIWKYCYSEIAFYMAYLLENNLLNVDSSINETVIMVKNRQETPDILIESMDGKLLKEDIQEEAVAFIDYALNDGFEEIDSAFEDISRRNTIGLADNYSEQYGRCLSFTFQWEDYDKIKPIIDKSYKDFNN